MLSDGVKEAGQDEHVKVLDVCEILWRSVE
jgi:hypothetical protein